MPRQSKKLNDVSERFGKRFFGWERKKDPESDFLEKDELPKFGHDPTEDIDE